MIPKKDHDPMCPVTAIHPWQICLCEAFELVRKDERQKIELQEQREINALLKKIIIRRDELSSQFWRHEREVASARLAEMEAEYERKSSKGWRCSL